MVPAVEDDPQRRKPDITRAKTYLNWIPKVSFIFLAIFRNEITTMLTPSTSEGDEWGRWWVVTFFVLKIPD